MTTEQKARAYDAALERAKAFELPEYKNIMASVFPELAESEDERIKREILELVSIAGNGNQFEEIKDWLEKQGKETSMFSNIEDDVRRRNTIQVLEYAKSLDTYNQYGKADIDKNIAWLEKLGEQNFDYEHADISQKDFSPIKSKFKVGDWLQYRYAEPFLVEEITEQGYCNSNSCLPFEWEDEIHLWSIDNAKDGDALVASDGSIFLFAGVDGSACKYYVAIATDNHVEINKETKGGYWETSRAVYPATKEQRDLLFQKMADAGYEFVNGHVTRF